MRLYLSALAYILVSSLRRVGLKGTELAQAQVSTIRIKLLKIGAQIRVSVRKVWVSMASSYPWQASTSRSGRTCAAETPLARPISSVLPQPARPGSDQCAATASQSPTRPRRPLLTPIHSSNRLPFFRQIIKRTGSQPFSPLFATQESSVRNAG